MRDGGCVRATFMLQLLRVRRSDAICLLRATDRHCCNYETRPIRRRRTSVAASAGHTTRSDYSLTGSRQVTKLPKVNASARRGLKVWRYLIDTVICVAVVLRRVGVHDPPSTCPRSPALLHSVINPIESLKMILAAMLLVPVDNSIPRSAPTQVAGVAVGRPVTSNRQQCNDRPHR